MGHDDLMATRPDRHTLEMNGEKPGGVMVEVSRRAGEHDGYVRSEVAMKALGIVAIFAGILVIILALTGVIGQGAGRAVIIAAIILLAVGYFLYKRGLRPPA